MTIREIPANYNTKVSVVFLHVNLLLVLSIPPTVTWNKCNLANCIVDKFCRSEKCLGSHLIPTESLSNQKSLRKRGKSIIVRTWAIINMELFT